MPLDVDPAPVRGVWFRHVPADGPPLHRPAYPGNGRWQRGEVVEGFYLADSELAAWAEWYRSLALCLFRSRDELAGVSPVPPPTRHDEPPAPPRGLRA